MMKTKCILSVVFLILTFSGGTILAQGNVVLIDTVKVKVSQSTTGTGSDEQGVNADAGRDQIKDAGRSASKANKSNSSKTVKKITSGRPDMSKSKGARPPVIVRPAGSGIPKGVGKPAGVGKKGGR
jgi:hypothetical protein